MDSTRRDTPNDIPGDPPKVEKAPPTGEVSIGARFGDMSELPDELLSQLVGHGASQDEQNVLTAINYQLEGVASIDEILVALWRMDGVVQDRKIVAARLFRMVKKGDLISGGKRGVYQTLMEIPEKTFSKEK